MRRIACAMVQTKVNLWCDHEARESSGGPRVVESGYLEGEGKALFGGGLPGGVTRGLSKSFWIRLD